MESSGLVRMRDRRVAHLKNWEKGHSGQEHREQWKKTWWAGKEQEFTLEHAECQEQLLVTWLRKVL